jgi:hypothetical protein
VRVIEAFVDDLVSSLTDPDALSMIARDTGIVRYNVQTTVDAKTPTDRGARITNGGRIVVNSQT